MMTFEEYKNYYIRSNYKYFPDGQYCNPKKILKDNQIEFKYNKYIKGVERKTLKGNSKYIQKIFDVEEECKNEDPFAVKFYSRIKELDKQWNTDFHDYFKKMNKVVGDIYDPCHIISRGTNRKLSSLKENIIIMPRYVHSLLDQYYEIFSVTPKSISRKRHEEIWKLIVGEEKYNYLIDLHRG